MNAITSRNCINSLAQAPEQSRVLDGYIRGELVRDRVTSSKALTSNNNLLSRTWMTFEARPWLGI